MALHIYVYNNEMMRVRYDSKSRWVGSSGNTKVRAMFAILEYYMGWEIVALFTLALVNTYKKPPHRRTLH